MFLDTAELNIKAGKGGDGRSSFRRVKYNAFGGPDGGDGARGGSIILRAEHNQDTLSAFRTKRVVAAQAGEAGKANKSRGKAGEDIVVLLPVGTIVYHEHEVIVDLTQDGQEFVAAKGGRGGYGNAHFVSSVRQAPEVAELGESGEEKLLTLELKLVADVGLVGLPNAGKSTFLAVTSNARPKIADYAFTTLAPNLGIVAIDDMSFVVADIPGLIEGASQGKGLGVEFLRHVTRTAVLLHLVDSTSEDPLADYETITEELAAYGHGLVDKPRIVVLNKVDAAVEVDLDSLAAKLAKESGVKVLQMAAVTKQGVIEVLRALKTPVQQARAENKAEEEEAAKVVFDEVPETRSWWLDRIDDGWVIHGEKIEGFARRTNFDQKEGVQRLRDIIKKMGIKRELERRGVEIGDKVAIADKILEFE